MVWIRLGISCIVFLSAAGSILFGMTKLMERLGRIENPILLLNLQKLSLLFEWIPVSFLCVCIPRISYENGVKSYCGEFVCSTVPSMTIAFLVLGCIWFIGFLCSVAMAAMKRHRLFCLEKGNVPVEQARYLAIFEACRKQLGAEPVLLFQNDLIASPITAGILRRRVILPFADYTDAQLWMIYEHELMHIKNNDLFWRMAGLVTSWVHWFNPLIYVQCKELACLQEMICDLCISIDNVHFTKKEYAIFLTELADNENFPAYTLALTKNRNQTARRIEKMKNTGKLTKPKKRIIALCCVGLGVLALIPATMLSAKSARLQEDWIRDGEVAVELALQDDADSDVSIEKHGFVDGRVAETEGILALESRSASVDLEKTIDADTRHLYGYRSMADGDAVRILASCDDSEILYRIGIKNKETGALTYITGTGALGHTFRITQNGTYAAYVENCSQTSMNVSGTAAFVSGASVRSADSLNAFMATSMVSDKNNTAVSECSFALIGKEERGEGITPEGILLGKDNQLTLKVQVPLMGEEHKKIAVQIFLDYHQIPFTVDGKTYDTYYMEAWNDISFTKEITLAADIDRSVDHKITALLFNDLQAGAGELLYMIGNGTQVDALLICDEKKGQLVRPKTAYETAYQEYEGISGGIFLTLEKGEEKIRIPDDTIHVGPGETVKVYYHLAGAAQAKEALVFLTIGEKQVIVNGKDFLLFQEPAKNRVLYGELEMIAPMEPGKYDVSAWVVYNPYGETDGIGQSVEHSPRFTLCVEK